MLLYIVVLLSLCIIEVKSKLCRNFYTGDIFYCPHYQACCRDHCCTAPLSFYNLWYFWLFILLLLLLCSGGGYWYKRRYVPLPRPTMRGPYMTTTTGRNVFGGGGAGGTTFQSTRQPFQQQFAGRPFGASNVYYATGTQGGYPIPLNNFNKPQYYPYPQDFSYYAGQPHMAPPPSYQDLYQDGSTNAFPPNPSIPIPMPPPTSTTFVNSPMTSNTSTNTVTAQR